MCTEKINFEINHDTKTKMTKNNREIFINKFIKKFPKTNLYTVTQINKLYNNQYNLNNVNVNVNDKINHKYIYLIN